jgi:3-phenylpropionate/cinnamic acid dioxygenase small subunit
MQRVEPLLCNDREISKYTRDVSRQRLGKQVPETTDTNATMVQQQRNGVLYVVRAEMIEPGWFGTTSYVQECSVESPAVKGRLCVVSGV